MMFHDRAKAPIPMRSVPLPNNSEAPSAPGRYQEAGSFNRDDYLLDPDLLAPIHVHMAMHFTPQLKIENGRGLLIAGSPGDTKTTTIRVNASRQGVDVLQMTAADLHGATEGKAVERLNAAHDFMKYKSAETGRRVLFQLDDLDASILDERKDQERSVNTNLLAGKLQNILESPDGFCDAAGFPICFVFTANGIENFRAPLLRDGRCHVFHYRPTWQRKAEMLTHHLKPTTDRDRKRLRCLVYKYQSHPIVWFTSLADHLRRAAIAGAVATRGLHDHAAITAAAVSVRTARCETYRMVGYLGREACSPPPSAATERKLLGALWRSLGVLIAADDAAGLC